MKPDFSAFSMKLAGFLMMKGFVLRHVKDDEKSRRKVFIFNDSNEIQQALKEYKNLNK